MSRYTATDKNGKLVAYGFDYDEYFVHVDGGEVVGSLSETPGTAMNALKKLEKLGVSVPEAHRNNLCLDLPI